MLSRPVYSSQGLCCFGVCGKPRKLEVHYGRNNVVAGKNRAGLLFQGLKVVGGKLRGSRREIFLGTSRVFIVRRSRACKGRDARSTG